MARYTVKRGQTGFTSLPMDLHSVGAECQWKSDLSSDLTAPAVNVWWGHTLNATELAQFKATPTNAHFVIRLAERSNTSSGLIAWHWGANPDLASFRANMLADYNQRRPDPLRRRGLVPQLRGILRGRFMEAGGSVLRGRLVAQDRWLLTLRLPKKSADFIRRLVARALTVPQGRDT